MSKQQKPGAYFDVDGTIFKSSLLEKVVQKGVEKSVFVGDAFEEAARLRQYWQFDNNEKTYLSYIRALVGGYVAEIAGVAVVTHDEIVGDVIDEHRVRRFKFPRMLMDELSDSHHFVAISGSPSGVVSKFVDDMPFLDVVGSQYEIENSRFTGHATATPEKAKVREALIEGRNLLALGDVALGDTMGDRSILGAVEFPIAFNPSATLNRHSRQLGWPIVIEQKDNITVLESTGIRTENDEYRYVSSDLQSIIKKIRNAADV